MECFKLDENEIYDISLLSLEEKRVLGAEIFIRFERKDCWLDERYLEDGVILGKHKGLEEWFCLYNSFFLYGDGTKETVLPTKNAKELFCSTKKHSYSWEKREVLRNKWFKRKNSQEESMVRHIQNKKNMTTGEFELHINGINIEQFEKEFGWI